MALCCNLASHRRRSLQAVLAVVNANAVGTDDEVARFSTQLSAILGYVEKLNELDTDSVEPLAHCLPIHNVFREDVVTESLDTALALENAPQHFENFFKVPKILEDDSGA